MCLDLIIVDGGATFALWILLNVVVSLYIIPGAPTTEALADV